MKGVQVRIYIYAFPCLLYMHMDGHMRPWTHARTQACNSFIDAVVNGDDDDDDVIALCYLTLTVTHL